LSWNGNGFLAKIRHCRTARMKAKSPSFHCTGSAFHDLSQADVKPPR
jgi:hypothetical protein